MATYNSFTELDCWKKARQIRITIEEIVKTLPKDERFDLADNMRRAARSCTRNIAEGFGRFHHQENIQFCRISRGSMHELLDDLITCKENGYATEELFLNTSLLIEDGIKSLNGYIKYLKSAKDKLPEK